MPTMPTPFSAAPMTDATAVPWTPAEGLRLLRVQREQVGPPCELRVRELDP